MIDETLLADPRFVAWAKELLAIPKVRRTAQVDEVLRLACPPKKKGRPSTAMTPEELATTERGVADLGITAKKAVSMALRIAEAVRQHGPDNARQWIHEEAGRLAPEEMPDAEALAKLAVQLTATPAPGKPMPKPDAARVRTLQNRLSTARRKHRK